VQSEDAISVIKEDLLVIEEHKQEFTSTFELKLIESLLVTLESKLQVFKQTLPKLDPRRCLLNFGCAVLKTLFGTAAVSDIASLHNAFEELQLSHKNVVHSLTNQLTYTKKLDTVTSVNVEAIANLSSIIKDNIINSRTIPVDYWCTCKGQSLCFL
jgi:hypothetical protein